jgi:hypothetical protein
MLGADLRLFSTVTYTTNIFPALRPFPARLPPGVANAELSFMTASTIKRSGIFVIAGFSTLAVGAVPDLGAL